LTWTDSLATCQNARTIAEMAERPMDSKLPRSWHISWSTPDAADRLVAELAHDVANLLMPVTTNCAFLLKAVPDDGPTRRCLEGVERAAEQASLIAHRLLLRGLGTRRAVSNEPTHRGTSEAWLSSSLEDLLALIQGYCRVLLPVFPEGDTRRADVVQMESAARRAHRLSSLLPGIAQGEVDQSEVLDLNALVADLDGIVRRLLGEGIELTTDLEPELGHICGDPIQIERIILNLTTNARDAMRGEGRLTIQTKTAESQADADPCSRCVMLSVSDTGCGMDDDTLSSAFLPRFTTKGTRGGTGLGLSIVREVVDQSDGRIQVHSSPGQGTTFEISWPLLQRQGGAGKYSADALARR